MTAKSRTIFARVPFLIMATESETADHNQSKRVAKLPKRKDTASVLVLNPVLLASKGDGQGSWGLIFRTAQDWLIPQRVGALWKISPIRSSSAV